jgi:homoserine kinase type II
LTLSLRRSKIAAIVAVARGLSNDEPGNATLQQRHRATFDAEELAIVLSHYELGIIESITEFARGSRQSPKVGIVTEGGKYLLKRRPAERARLDRVRFAHRVQDHLIQAGFPLARLIRTRLHQATLLQLRDQIYELFEFRPGHAFAQKPEEARDAGVVLARFHEATGSFDPPASLTKPRGDYHDAAAVRTGMAAIGSALSMHDSFTGDELELTQLVEFLLSAYNRAADSVNRQDLSSIAEQVIHSDWHPGNLLFRENRVFAVVDYDSMRYARRIIDVANGALQFSMIAKGDPASWPDELDLERYAAFLAGYESISGLSPSERECLVPLMIEALIAECVSPIAATGSVGRWAGYRVLQMVRRKIGWLNAEATRLG